MAYFERIMATLTAALLLALIGLTAAHFAGARLDASSARKAVVIVGPLLPAVDPAEVSAAAEAPPVEPSTDPGV